MSISSAFGTVLLTTSLSRAPAAFAPYGSDLEITSSRPPCNDSISSLGFRPSLGFPAFLNASMWDGEVRCYELSESAQCEVKASVHMGTPVLCSAWMGDSASILAGCADKELRRWDVESGQVTTVGRHDAPIQEVCWERGANVCVTGAWDKKACIWDARASADRAQHTMPVSERVYCMDVSGPMLVVGDANQRMTLFDLRKPEVSLKVFASLLSKQLRSIACHTDRRGFACGSIEGRVGVQYLDSENDSKNFAFKCHRDANAKHIFTVNAIKFHPMGSFVTGGADGTVCIWDHHSRKRLKEFKKVQSPITAVAWNSGGNLLAYAASYDWGRGHSGAVQAFERPQIFIHACLDSEVRPNSK